MKKVIWFFAILWFVLVIDYLIGFRTYYNPGLGVFIRYQIVYNDSTVSRDSIAWGSRKTVCVWFNYLDDNLLKVRFAKPYQDNIDYIAMLDPDYWGCWYYIHTETRQVFYQKVDRLDNNVVLKINPVSVIKAIVPLENVFHDDPPFTEFWLESFYVNDVLKPEYISITNDRGAVFGDSGMRSSSKLKRAHLWHLIFHP